MSAAIPPLSMFLCDRYRTTFSLLYPTDYSLIPFR